MDVVDAPADVHRLLADRIDLLDDDAALVLKAASVLGPTFSVDDLGAAELLDLGAGRVRAAIDDLVERDLVVAARRARAPLPACDYPGRRLHVADAHAVHEPARQGRSLVGGSRTALVERRRARRPALATRRRRGPRPAAAYRGGQPRRQHPGRAGRVAPRRRRRGPGSSTRGCRRCGDGGDLGADPQPGPARPR